ncbi:MAG TPA: hypothetical protein VLS49_00170 [Usitatibacter sp.]|nr:hypothetical protein [Usitatibacter sp.]
MDEPRFFADVDLPFHVWVREGRRWVLRDAASRLQSDSGPRAAGGDAERGRRDPGAGRT